MGNKFRLQLLTIAAVAGVAAGLATATPASATDEVISPASACFSFDGASQAAIEVNDWGQIYLSATSGTYHRVACGLSQPGATLDTNDDVFVYFNDANAINTRNFYCYVTSVVQDFSFTSSTVSRYGSSTAGGQSVDSGTFSGASYIELADIEWGFDTVSVLTCRIPVNDDLGAASEIRSILVESD